MPGQEAYYSPPRRTLPLVVSAGRLKWLRTSEAPLLSEVEAQVAGQGGSWFVLKRLEINQPSMIYLERISGSKA